MARSGQPMTTNVLLSSAGRRVALLDTFRDALRSLGLPGKVMAADASACSAAAWAADDRFVVPLCTDDAFVPAMLELCRRERVALVVPTIDTELMVLAQHRAAFAEIGTLVSVSSPGTIAVAEDKRRTHAFLVDRGFPTVAQAEVEEVRRDPGSWRYPLIVKPVNGSASEGVVRVDDDLELAVATSGVDTVVQVPARGVEYTVDLFVDESGTCRGAVPRQRLEVRAGEVVKAVTARIPPLLDLAEQLAKSLPGAFGVLNLQLFYEAATGHLRIIEINPRFGGGFPLSHRAGAPFVRWLVELAAGRVPDYDVPPWRDGLMMLRYDDAVFVEHAPGAG